MNDFCVGERVECIIPSVFVRVGEQGVVCFVDRDIVGVRWDSHHYGRHDCGRLCDDGHGWNMKYTKLDRVYDDTIEFDETDTNTLISLVIEA